MNRFVEHHRDLIQFSYSCFDRMICNACLPQFQHTFQAGTIVWFLRTQRHAGTINRAYFAKLANDYHLWLADYARKTGVPVVEPDRDGRRQDWVEPYYRQLGDRPGVAVILKCREPERIAVHFAKSNTIAVQPRCINLYYYYLNDPHCGRMFLRLCPYFPFHARLWLNGHNWLACRLRDEGIAFTLRDNVFVACAQPQRLQQLADTFGPQDLRQPAAHWLAQMLPFFSAAERQQGYTHQLYMAQMEYCHNLIFPRQAAAQRLLERLMDVNRGLGHPDKLATYFGRPRFHPDTRTGHTVVKMTRCRTPVISSAYGNTSIKQYVSHGVALRTESTTYQLRDLGLNKNVQHLPALRAILAAANERYENAQQDVLATYVDRGQLQQLRQPSVSASGRRVPGLHVDDPRLLAVLQALTCFVYLAGKGCFRTQDLLADVRQALDNPAYRLSQLRYDLSKVRAKGWVQRCPGRQVYQLTADGYRLAFLYLKLYHRLYAPLTAGLAAPVAGDNGLLSRHHSTLDRLYTAVDQALHKLTDFLGIAA